GAKRARAWSCSWEAARSSCPGTGTSPESVEPALPGLLEVRAWPGADDRLLGLAVLEQDHRRDRAHAEQRRVAGVVVDVDLRERDLGMLLGELLQDRRDGPAGPAPG